MQVLWVDAFSHQPTLRHDLIVDRGMPFEAACRHLAHERASPSDASGFRRSKRPMFGRDMYLLAVQKPGAPGLFNICRPNTGGSYFDMEVFFPAAAPPAKILQPHTSTSSAGMLNAASSHTFCPTSQQVLQADLLIHASGRAAGWCRSAVSTALDDVMVNGISEEGDSTALLARPAVVDQQLWFQLDAVVTSIAHPSTISMSVSSRGVGLKTSATPHASTAGAWCQGSTKLGTTCSAAETRSMHA